MGKNYSYTNSMDEHHINFNIFVKYSDLESWQKAELSSKVKKRRRGKKRNGIGLANYFSAKKHWTSEQ